MSTSNTVLQPGQSIKPLVSLKQAKAFIKQYFGIETTLIKELVSYDDKNFYVEAGSNHVKKYVFKVLNSMDSRRSEHVEAEHEMMFRLSSNGIQCPIPQKTLDGETFKVVPIPREDIENANDPAASPTGTRHLIRLLLFVEGTILHNVPVTANLLYESGAYIAKMQNILKTLKHPGLDSHKSVWMLGEVLQLEKFVFAIEGDPKRYKMVKEVLEAYRTKVEPLVPDMESGTVHGDFNEQNILVHKSQSGDDYEIAGILDFGDASSSPYIFDLAITMCYMILESVRCGTIDPFEAIAQVVAGYHSVHPVLESELKLIRILVACRFCQSLVMGAYTHLQDPDNAYVLTTSARGWKLLDQLWNEKTDEQVANICKQFLKQ